MTTDTDKELVSEARGWKSGTSDDSVRMVWLLNKQADAIERLSADVERLMGALTAMLSVKGDHMTACDKIMGDTHPCTCGADKARSALQTGGQSE